MSSSNILISNALLYTLTLFLYFIKNKSLNVGVVLLSLYTIAAWASVLLENHELFIFSIHYSKITIEPFVYLYIALMLFILPLLRFKSNEITHITPPSETKLSLLIKVLIIINIFCIIIQIPTIQDMGVEINWEELKGTHYESEIRFWFYKYSILSHINLLGTAFLPISMALSFYAYFLLDRNKLYTVFFYSTLLLEILVTIVNGNRGNIIIDIVFMFCMYLLFKKFISEKKIKKLRYLLIITSLPLILFFITITQSRFGSEMVSYYNIKYAGESFINFNGLMYDNLQGTTNGRAYFTLFNRVFNPESIDFETGIQKWDFIEKETNVRGQYFYTLIGALCFEFGKVGTVFIAISFLIIASMILNRNKSITIPQVLFFATSVYLIINGVFFFKLQGTTGNLTILLLIVLMIYFSKSEKAIKKI